MNPPPNSNSSDIPPLGNAREPTVGIGQNNNAQILGVNIGITLLALLIICLRLVTRVFIVRSCGWDDGFIVLSTILAIAMAGINCAAVGHGMGQHIGDITPASEMKVEMFHWITQLLYPATLGFAKLSILVFLRRLSPNEFFRRTVHFFIGFVLALTISTTFAIIFMCDPVAMIFDRTLKGSCVNRTALFYSTAGFNILTDLAIVVLPIPTFLKVQIPRKQKRILVAVFSLGGFVCVASIVRLTTLYALARSLDPTWVMARFSVWTATEAALAIICACIPSLKPLTARYFPKLLFSSDQYMANSAVVHGKPSNPSAFSLGNRHSYPLTNITGGHGRRSRDGGTYGGDNDSEEYIVGRNQTESRLNSAGITKTTDINVHVSTDDIATVGSSGSLSGSSSNKAPQSAGKGSK